MIGIIQNHPETSAVGFKIDGELEMLSLVKFLFDKALLKDWHYICII